MTRAAVVLWVLSTLAFPAFAEPPAAGPSTTAAASSTRAEFEAAVRELDTPVADDEAEAIPSFGWALVQMVIVLGAVSLLAYFLLGKVLPKIMRVQTPTAPTRLLEVVDRLPIDQRRAILIIKLGERHFLVGASEGSITLLSRLEPEEIDQALAMSSSRDVPSWGKFRDALLKRTKGES